MRNRNQNLDKKLSEIEGVKSKNRNRENRSPNQNRGNTNQIKNRDSTTAKSTVSAYQYVKKKSGFYMYVQVELDW